MVRTKDNIFHFVIYISNIVTKYMNPGNSLDLCEYPNIMLIPSFTDPQVRVRNIFALKQKKRRSK